MASITYDKASLIDALESGTVTLVVSAFGNKIRENTEEIIKEVCEALDDELPIEIEGNVYNVFDMSVDRERIQQGVTNEKI